MLKREEAALIFIDVQGKLHEIMHEKEVLDANLERLIAGAKVLGMPIIGTEQIPEKLGPTHEPFLTMLDGFPRIGKSAFSCCGEAGFAAAFKASGARQAVLAGIETHICVYQTALDLLEQGIEVFAAADAVASRTAENKGYALEAMRQAGAVILPTESILLALQRDAAAPTFRELLKLIK